MHGMPLAMNMKLNDAESYPGWEWLKEIPTLSPRQVRSKPFDSTREIVCLVFFTWYAVVVSGMASLG